MYMNKKLFSLFLVIFLFVGVGCKGLTPEQQAAIEPVTLNYWTVYNDTAQLRAFAEAYTKIRPYVKVNVRQVRSDTFDDLFVTSLADNQAPDIISMHIRNLPKHAGRLDPMPSSVQVATMYEKGKYRKELVVEQITQVMPSKTEITRDYISTVLPDVTVGGSIYGLPLAVDTLAVYYNRGLLDKAGVAQPPTTWEELLDVVTKTTVYNSRNEIVQSGIALGTLSNISNGFDIFSALLLQSKVEIGNETSVLLSSGGRNSSEANPVLQALDFYTAFARPTKVTYSWNTEMKDAFESFVSGQSAFYIGYAFEYKRIKARAPQMVVESVPLYQLDEEDKKNIANYWVETVVKEGKHKDEAWDFVRFISTPENVAIYTKATGQLSPYRKQIAELQKDDVYGPFASQALVAENWYQGKDFTTAHKAFQDLVEGYLRPYSEDEKPLDRDSALVRRAVQVLKQTY
jgi:multiple sugar transport system substrate-binding protein